MRDAFDIRSRSTFGGKLVGAAKSRKHGVKVAIVWVAWAHEEKFGVQWFPSVFVERSYWQGGDRQRKFWVCVHCEKKWWRVIRCKATSPTTRGAGDTFIFKGSSNPEMAAPLHFAKRNETKPNQTKPNQTRSNESKPKLAERNWNITYVVTLLSISFSSAGKPVPH